MKRIFKNEKGAISIFTVMVLAVLIPFAILVGLELPKMHQSNEKVKEAVDIAASSIVTQISNEGFADNEIYFNQDRFALEETAKKMFATELGVKYENGKFIIPENSNVSEAEPIQFDIQMYDDSDLNGGSKIVQSRLSLNEREKEERDKIILSMLQDGASTDEINKEKKRWDSEWTKEIRKPTISVEAKVTFKKVGFFGRDYTVNQYGMSQVNNKLK